jgi:hypothetical protein
MGSLADHIYQGLYPSRPDLSISDKMIEFFSRTFIDEGIPEGVVTADVGSEYTDLDTGLKYYKLSGTGNTGWVRAVDLNDLDSLDTRKTVTAVKTANYNAAVNQIIPCDISAVGSFTVTLPTTPTDGSTVSVKIVTFAVGKILTVAAGGAAVFNKVGGSATATMSVLNQQLDFTYKATGDYWIVESSLPLSAISVPPPAYVSGKYYRMPNGNDAVSVTMTTGSLRLAPVYLPKAVNFTKLGAAVSIVGDVGSKIRLGIYADDGTFSPGALIVDAGVIAGDSATVQELTINNTIGPGWFWFGGVVQVVTVTQPTCRIVQYSAVGLPIDYGTAAAVSTSHAVGKVQTGVTAGLPDPCVPTGQSTLAFAINAKVA